MTLFRHVLSILLLPVTVALFVPYWILSSRSSYPLSLTALSLGAGVIGCGLALVVVTIRHFATLGQEYKRHVPRWVPRRTAWMPPGA